MYRKLKRTWTHNSLNFDLQRKLKKVFPELKHLDGDEMCDRFIELNLDFYTEEKTPVSFWTRLSMPFAFLTMLIIFIGIPFNFLITGQWGYSLGKESRLFNWFRSVGLQ